MTELWPTVATTISINSYGGGGHTTGDGGNTSLGGSVNVIWNHLFFYFIRRKFIGGAQ